MLTTAKPRCDTDPLRVMFLHTSAVIGGAETLLQSLIHRMDRTRFAPELCCLKALGPIGESLAQEIPTCERLLRSKYDLRVLPRLTRLLRRRRIDAVVTVGAGDKMFWGRLAARLAGVPVVISALHSTGWPDSIGRLNRLLTPLTDAFVAVADGHGRHLVEVERLPADRVRVIRNGIDVDRFRPRDRRAIRAELGLPADAPVVGLVARLRHEKNIELFLDVAARVRAQMPHARFLIVGDGPQWSELQELAQRLGMSDSVQFLGARADVPELLAALDVFLLTSHIEASPVSILEALATGVPVIATRVGSITETVAEGQVGHTVAPGDAAAAAARVLELLAHPEQSQAMGAEGRRRVVETASLEQMVADYQTLIADLHAAKTATRRRPHRSGDNLPAAAELARGRS